MNKDSSSYFESEAFHELLSRYEDARKENSNSYFDPDQLSDISDYYTSKGALKKAYETVEYALYLHPGNTEMMVTQAHLFIDDDRIDEAEAIAGSIKDNSDYEVTLLRAELLLIRGNEEEAEDRLRQYIDIEGKESDYYIDIAYLFIDNGFSGKAIAWFEEALKEFPGNLEVMEGLAESYFEANQPENAIRYYNLLLDENPYSTAYWTELGKIYFTSEEYNKAIEAYEFVTAIDKENRHAALMLGHCYAKLENYPKAEAYYLEFSAKTEQGDHEHSYYYLGICYYSMGEFQKAIDFFLKGIETDGELVYQPVDIYSYIFECYGELGDKEHALRYIDLAIAEDPENMDAWFSKVRFLLNAGEIDEAYRAINEAVAIMPPDVPNAIEAGILLANFQKYDSALSVFKLLENSFPLAYHLFTAFIYHSTGNPDLYKEHIQQAMELSPEGFWDKLKDPRDEDVFTLMKNILLEMYEKNNN